MTGRVSLVRVTGSCPSCNQPHLPYTHPLAGTRIRACDPNRCRIARVFALAAGPRPAGWEPQQVDDRYTNRRAILGAR